MLQHIQEKDHIGVWQLGRQPLHAEIAKQMVMPERGLCTKFAIQNANLATLSPG
jgi:hypothetical protein